MIMIIIIGVCFWVSSLFNGTVLNSLYFNNRSIFGFISVLTPSMIDALRFFLNTQKKFLQFRFAHYSQRVQIGVIMLLCLCVYGTGADTAKEVNMSSSN